MSGEELNELAEEIQAKQNIPYKDALLKAVNKRPDLYVKAKDMPEGKIQIKKTN